MRAVLCKAFGPPESLVLEEVDDPVAGDGQVVIDIHACAVNFPDVLIIQDMYQFKPPLPFSPGAEVAGVVSSVGPGVTELKVGDRVLSNPGWGGLAEKVAVNAGQAMPIGDELDFEHASAFMYAYGTSHYALKDRAHLQPGESLVVLGAAGGVGLAAVELGALMGANVIAAASTDDKLELCREYGASMTINYSTEDLKTRIRELTGGAGADVVYDAVGGTYSEPALRSMAWEGRFLVIGFAAGEIPKIPLNLALLKGCQICGVFWGSFAMRDPVKNRANGVRIFEWIEQGKLKPHVDGVFPFTDAKSALERMERREVKGKLVLVP